MGVALALAPAVALAGPVASAVTELVEQERFDEAAAVLDKYRGRWVNRLRGELEHRKGVVLARDGRHREGLRAIERAARLRPADLSIFHDRIVVLNWARLHWESVDGFEALKHPEAAPDYVRREAAEAYRASYRFAAALELYVSLLDGDDARVLESIRSMLLAQSARFLEPAVRKHPAWLAGYRWTTPGVEEALGAGDPLFAKKALRDALARGPLVTAVLADWLVLLHLAGRHEEALLLWPALPNHRALSPRIVAALGRVGRHDEAVALARDVPEARGELVHALLRGGWTTEAADVANKLEGFGSLRVKADVELFLGHAKKAAALYTKAILESTPVDPAAQVGGAIARALLDRTDDAVRLIADALTRVSLDDYLLHHALSEQASMALARLLNDTKRPALALTVLESVPQAIEPLFEQARAFELLGRRVEAARTYEQLLVLDASKDDAAKARVRVLSQLLALTPAQAEARRLGDAELERTVRRMEAVREWNRQGAPGSVEQRASEVLAVLRSSRAGGLPVGEGLLRAAATAAVEVDDDARALELYGALYERLVERGDGAGDEAVDLRLSQVRCLVRMLRFAEAERMLDQLDERVPLRQPGSNQPNWGKAAIAIERGWLLIAQDRLAEARAHFLRMQRQAPGSAATQSGLAHTHLLLGWKRQALAQFEQGAAFHPDDRGLRIGLGEALRVNGETERATRLSAELSKLVPDDRNVRDLARRLKFDRRPRITTSATADTQARNIGGAVAELQLEVPVRSDLVLRSGFALRREAAGPGDEAIRRRATLGARFTRNRDLAFGASVAADPLTGRWGLAADVSYERSDRSWLGARANTDAWSLPPGALRAGASGRELFATAGHSFTETLELFAELGVLSMSDGTVLPTAMAEVRQQLIARGAWRLTLALESGGATASQPQELYYAPTWLWTNLQPALEHTWRSSRSYRLEDRLSLQGGVDVVQGFGAAERLGVFYEQTHGFGDRGELVFETGLTRRFFDGVPELGWTLGLAGRVQF